MVMRPFSNIYGKVSRYLLSLAILLTAFSARGQKPYATENFDINGLTIGSVIDNSTLRDVLGEPDSIDETFSNEVFLYYGETELCLISGVLVSIISRDGAFPLMTSTIEGGIKVGDDVNATINKILRYTASRIIESSTGFIVGSWEDRINFDVKNGKITSISYCDPALGI